MAVNFRSIGTVKLSGGGRLVCTPESQIASSGGGGADVTPNPTPNWIEATYNAMTGQYNYTTQQIQGIDTTITLKLEYNDTSIGKVWYSINNIDPIPLEPYPPSGQPSISFTQISNNGTFTVSNNQWVTFGLEANGSINGQFLVTVRNQSDSNVVLDTFFIIQMDTN